DIAGNGCRHRGLLIISGNQRRRGGRRLRLNRLWRGCGAAALLADAIALAVAVLVALARLGSWQHRNGRFRCRAGCQAQRDGGGKKEASSSHAASPVYAAPSVWAAP